MAKASRRPTKPSKKVRKKLTKKTVSVIARKKGKSKTSAVSKASPKKKVNNNKNVFVAMLMKDAIRKGQREVVVIASAGVIVLEWLAEYLEEHYKATASLDACYEVIFSLELESVKLAGGLP